MNKDLKYKEISAKYDKLAQEAEASQECSDIVEAFTCWGDELYDLAKIKKDESLFKEAVEKYIRATRLENDNPWPLIGLGDALHSLAKIKQDESLFEKAIEKYAKATQDYTNAYAFIQQGAALVNLAKIKKDESLNKKAYKCFEESKESILEIFVKLDDKADAEQIIKMRLLYPLLDLDTSDDGRFFREITEKISQEKLDKYKEIFILSVFIISQLVVNNENEKLVAYYTTKVVSGRMLFNGSKFRLNAINYSNDPTEGSILLDYLYGASNSIKQLHKKYRAFAGCFTFNYDNLNQFRLYGKEDKHEGTGLSLVFCNNFFSRDFKMATQQNKKRKYAMFSFATEEDENEDNSDTLFRCIYIDPIKQRVETVGRKEKYLFYREGNEKGFEMYDKYISSVIEIVDKKMKELWGLVKDLEQDVVEQLLINLRYLTKHVAFKEEQECRILKIKNLNDNIVKINDNFKQMYIEYLDIPEYVEKIIFGPKATDIKLFKDILIHKGLDNICCEKSENPLA